MIHPAESFVELDDEVICLRPRGVTEEDIRRRQNVFAQTLSFIAPALPAGQRGYSLDGQRCVEATPWLERFLEQLVAEYAHLRDSVADARERERRRQEWRFAEAGGYDKYFHGRTTRVNMQPENGAAYTYTLIENRPRDLYFTESKSGPKGRVVEQGDYRRHFHNVGRQSYQNLDFFPERDYPILWRLVKAGRGFKAFPRKLPRIANISFGSC